MATDNQGAVVDGRTHLSQYMGPVVNNGASSLIEAFANCPGGSKSYYGTADLTAHSNAEDGDSEALKAINTDEQRRAYEAMNYVLRNFGCRITEAQLPSLIALNKALGNATTHIDAHRLSPDITLLFRSLQTRFKDEIIIQGILASIYLLGALAAEISTSLPNYKEEYPALGSHVAKQFFVAAIGDEACQQDRIEKERAFKTLATIAELLQPTDIGYAIFPGFPPFSPSSYSSRKGSDVRAAKGTFDRLTKHFWKHGFPNPLPGREVGPISDWRFLSGDANGRTVDVEKADKHIGDNFGKVIYWLIYGASRMPTDRAVIVYHEQHRQLVRWLGHRLNFRTLTGDDLDMSPKHHLKLEMKLKAVLQSWLIIMPPLVPDTPRRSQNLQVPQRSLSQTPRPNISPLKQQPARQSMASMGSWGRRSVGRPSFILEVPDALSSDIFPGSSPQSPESPASPSLTNAPPAYSAPQDQPFQSSTETPVKRLTLLRKTPPRPTQHVCAGAG
ncbi:MAG: hypothetical protein M1837_005829 [Sclerophora amabilis]|nr:MAG: hypothetical protein M1837_005829 [Sclerophora amabilis]